MSGLLLPTCKDLDGECFARKNCKCICLKETSEGRCSFKKPKQFVTNGVTYSRKHPDERVGGRC